MRQFLWTTQNEEDPIAVLYSWIQGKVDTQATCGADTDNFITGRRRHLRRLSAASVTAGSTRST